MRARSSSGSGASTSGMNAFTTRPVPSLTMYRPTSSPTAASIQYHGLPNSAPVRGMSARLAPTPAEANTSE